MNSKGRWCGAWRGWEKLKKQQGPSIRIFTMHDSWVTLSWKPVGKPCPSTSVTAFPFRLLTKVHTPEPSPEYVLRKISWVRSSKSMLLLNLKVLLGWDGIFSVFHLFSLTSADRRSRSKDVCWTNGSWPWVLIFHQTIFDENKILDLSKM